MNKIFFDSHIFFKKRKNLVLKQKIILYFYIKNLSLMKILTFLSLLLCFSMVFSQSQTTIFDVSRNGDLELAKKMLKENPNVFNATNKDGYSALTLACYRGNVEMVKLMLKNNAEIDANSTMGTPLMAAVVKGNLDITKLLVQKNANVNLQDTNGTTALIYATMFKNYDIVSVLVKAKANIEVKDNKGKNALDYAIIADNDKLIETLKTKN